STTAVFYESSGWRDHDGVSEVDVPLFRLHWRESMNFNLTVFTSTKGTQQWAVDEYTVARRGRRLQGMQWPLRTSMGDDDDESTLRRRSRTRILTADERIYATTRPGEVADSEIKSKSKSPSMDNRKARGDLIEADELTGDDEEEAAPSEESTFSRITRTISRYLTTGSSVSSVSSQQTGPSQDHT
ncbi:unnamed protein product, partial [Amoebophrya sp. A25]